MGTWVVVVEYQGDGRDDYEILRDAGSTKEQALEVLRALLHTYLPRPRIVERWRQVYRFADGESYVVLIKGSVTQWRCTLRIAELVSDSTDPAVARLAREPAPTQLDRPQDQLGG
jgi:hypothetical protein